MQRRDGGHSPLQKNDHFVAAGKLRRTEQDTTMPTCPFGTRNVTAVSAVGALQRFDHLHGYETLDRASRTGEARGYVNDAAVHDGD